MYTTNGASERARWAVMWVHRKGGKKSVFRKDFGDDLASALELYNKARDGGRAAVTLACVNMGFPPPVQLRPRTVTKRGRDKRTGKVRTVTVTVDPMRELNITGKVYCPYCRAVRPFIKRSNFTVMGVHIVEPRYVCPICGVSHNDHNVRQWNPTASIHMTSSLAPRTRKPRASSTRRRSRR